MLNRTAFAYDLDDPMPLARYDNRMPSRTTSRILVRSSRTTRRATWVSSALPARPGARFSGHTDVVRGIAYIKDCDAYVTASWDKSLRLWKRPRERARGGATTSELDCRRGPLLARAPLTHAWQRA
jgi:hypothetical protein